MIYLHLEEELKKKRSRLQVNKKNVTTIALLVALLAGGYYVYSLQANAGKSLASAVDTANAEIGKPYVLGTQGPTDFDCSGLVYYAYQKKNNIKLADTRGTADDYWHTGTDIASMNDLKTGDLLFFEKKDDGRIHHIGVYNGDGTFTHASYSYGKVVKSKFSDHLGADRNRATYSDIYVGARRVKSNQKSKVKVIVLKKGSKGDYVQGLNRKLAKLGYAVDANGRTFNTKTEKAVKAFEKSYGLKADGIAGPIVLDKLDSALYSSMHEPID